MDMFLFLQDAAAGAAQQQPSAGEGLLRMLPMFGMIFVVMYFMMIRPQNKQRKERETMISNLKKNDHVLTTSGIFGVVKKAEASDPYVTLCIDERNYVCIRVSKESIARLEGDAKALAPETQEKKS